MTKPLTMRWADSVPPEQRLAELRVQMSQIGEEYIAADLEARDAGRRRMRALDAMRAARAAIVNLCAENNLAVPEYRFWRLLENDE